LTKVDTALHRFHHDEIFVERLCRLLGDVALAGTVVEGEVPQQEPEIVRGLVGLGRQEVDPANTKELAAIAAAEADRTGERVGCQIEIFRRDAVGGAVPVSMMQSDGGATR
jgi:hypothetical protein